MEIDKLDKWFALLTNVGVVAGIVFVSIEVSQNTEMLAAQDRYNRLDVATRGRWAILEDADLSKIMVSPDIELSEEDKIIFRIYWLNIFTGMEWTFEELETEQLPLLKWKRDLVVRPEILILWNEVKDSYNEGFVQYLELNVFQK